MGLAIFFQTFQVFLELSFAAFSTQPQLIRHVQLWLMSSTTSKATTAAASIAELLGGQDPEHVLAVARRTHSCVTADKLTFEDMKDNKPNPALGVLSQRAKLGRVDAFVSHSWHDDAGLKWAALQEWREEFKREHHGREPRLWIDKYCIDQNNIDESLACLPIYLAGCSKLLILCGSTYLERLWCLVEIFVFLGMGGQLENLEVQLLQRTRVPSFDIPGSAFLPASGLQTLPA